MAMSVDVVFTFETVKNCGCKVLLNGGPVFEAESNESGAESRNISMWVMPGPNDLVLYPPALSEGEAPQGSVDIGVHHLPAGLEVEDATPLCSLRWPNGAATPGPVSASFSPPTPIRGELFALAPQLTLDDQARAELAAFAERLHQLFAQRRPGELADMLEFKTRDLAKCFGKDEDSMLADMRSFVEEMLLDANFAVRPWKPEALQIEPVARGRVILLSHDGGMLLEGTGGQGFPIYVSQLDSTWTVVR